MFAVELHTHKPTVKRLLWDADILSDSDDQEWWIVDKLVCGGSADIQHILDIIHRISLNIAQTFQSYLL